MKKVFLGGSYDNNSDWRTKLTPLLDEHGINYLDVSSKSTEFVEPDEIAKYINNEKDSKNDCDIHLYYIDEDTCLMSTIAEAIQSAYLANTDGSGVSNCIFCVHNDGLSTNQISDLKNVMSIISKIAPNNSVCKFVNDMYEVALSCAIDYRKIHLYG